MGCNCKNRQRIRNIEEHFEKRGNNFLPRKKDKVSTKNALRAIFTWKGFCDALYRLLLVVIGVIAMIPIGFVMLCVGFFSKTKIFDYQKFLGLNKMRVVKN